MASKKNNKQKEKVISDYELQVRKIDTALKSLKDSIVSLQEGDGNQPYWNGSNAYGTIKNTLAYVDNCTVLLDYLNQCKDSIK